MKTLFTLLLYALASLIVGLALLPAAAFFRWMLDVSQACGGFRWLVVCWAASFAFFLFGIALVLVAGAFRLALCLKLSPGEHGLGSAEALKWYVLNGIQTLVSNVFMNFMILTPFAVLFYRLMGARVGRGVQINSGYCADLSLLEIGDKAVIGGHATVIAHSFEHGKLILRPVKIGAHAVIGLNSVVLPGSQIGEGATVAANAVVPKDTVVEPRSVYFGKKSDHAQN